MVAEAEAAPEDGAGGGPLLPADLLIPAAAAPCRMAVEEELGVTTDDADFAEPLLINDVLPAQRPLVDNVKAPTPLFDIGVAPELAIPPPTEFTTGCTTEGVVMAPLGVDELVCCC